MAIALILIILLLAVVLFATDLLRPDLIALLVLGALALTGLVSPSEALSGFSSPAVIAIWAMFIISSGLAATGIADRLGDGVLRLAGSSETRLLVVIMLGAALLSAVMNSVSVVALMLPVLITVARRTGHPPSRLLLPLSYATLLGGLTTLIGTTPNLLASEALHEQGLPPFNLFDFSPVGVPVMLAGILFMVTVGRHLLPRRDPVAAMRKRDLSAFYGLQERLQVLRVPAGSPLAGRSLADSRLGGLAGLNVIGVMRAGQVDLAPEPGAQLLGGDRLLVVGRADRLEEIRQRRMLSLTPAGLTLEALATAGIVLAEITIEPPSDLAGRTLAAAQLRRRYGANVLAITRGRQQKNHDLGGLTLSAGDRLVVLGAAEGIAALAEDLDGSLTTSGSPAAGYLDELVTVGIPADSSLAGKSLAATHLGDSTDLTILGRLRDGRFRPITSPEETLSPGDLLLAHFSRDSQAAWTNIATLEPDDTSLEAINLENEQVGFVEVTLSPFADIVGKSLRELHFRHKYGLTAVAIWRGGQAHRHRVRDRALRLGDGLLLYGPRTAWPLVASDPNFIVLEMDARPAPRPEKAVLALGILLVVLVPVLFNWLTLAIAAVIGAGLMVVSGCLTMDEAYRAIEWKAVFLIAGMMPLGIALENSQAAGLIAGGLVNFLGGWGVIAILAGLLLFTNIAAQLMPNSVVVVLMAPIAFQIAAQVEASPRSFMIAVAIAAAASLLSPVGHAANVLVMGPGGYRFADYFKVGLPLTVVLLVIAFILIPLIWPL